MVKNGNVQLGRGAYAVVYAGVGEVNRLRHNGAVTYCVEILLIGSGRTATPLPYCRRLAKLVAALDFDSSGIIRPSSNLGSPANGFVHPIVREYATSLRYA